MIWKDCLKLSEIASYSKFVRASKALPPSARRNRVNIVFEIFIFLFVSVFHIWKWSRSHLFLFEGQAAPERDSCYK